MLFTFRFPHVSIYQSNFLLIKIITKKDAPRNAVIMPIGISPGKINLARLSEIKRNIAPKTAEYGRLSNVFCPRSMRDKFGTISPTHPIMPVNAITDEVSNTAQPTRMYFSNLGFNPSEKEISSSRP